MYEVSSFYNHMSFDATQIDNLPLIYEEKSNFYNNPQGCLATLNSFIDRIKEKSDFRAFISTYEQEVRRQGAIINKKIEKKEEVILAGTLVGIKDLFSYKDHTLGASSKFCKDLYLK